MDGTRFDTLTKRLAAGSVSRRRVLRGLGAAGLTIGGGLLGPQAGAAFICRQDGVLCAKDAQCCSGSCVAYHCGCPTGTTSCGGACCAAGQICGQIFVDGQGCCYPPGTAGVCTAANFETVCCATLLGGGVQEVGCHQGTCT